MQTPAVATNFANQPTWAAADDFVFDGIHLDLGDQPILRDISLAFRRRETVAIIGESGCGKTTLLKIMIGLLAPTQGTAWFRGKSLAGMSSREQIALRRNFGFLFQAAALFDSMSVYDNIAFGLRTQGVLSEGEIQPIVEKQLEEVGLSASVGEKFPSELSGGMRKRVGLARALALNPEFMLFDEPTTGLDPVMTDVINELILKVRRNLGITGILVTHEMRTVRKVADRVIMLAPLASLEPNENQVLFDGSVAELDLCPDQRIRSFIQGDSQGGAKALARKPVQEIQRLPQLLSPQPVNSLPERPMAGLRWIDPEALQEAPAHFIPLFDRQKAESIKVAMPPLESFANPIPTVLATSPVILDSILASPTSVGSHPAMRSIEATTESFQYPPTMDQAEDDGGEVASSQNGAQEDEASEEGESDDEEEDPEPGPAQEMNSTAAFAIGTLGVAAAGGLAAAAEPAFAISPAVPQWFLDQDNPNERHRFLPVFAPSAAEPLPEEPAATDQRALSEDIPNEPGTSILGQMASDILEDQTDLPLEREAEESTEAGLSAPLSEDDQAEFAQPLLNLLEPSAARGPEPESEPNSLAGIASALLEDQTGLPLERAAEEPAEGSLPESQNKEDQAEAALPPLHLLENGAALEQGHEPGEDLPADVALDRVEDQTELPLEFAAEEPAETGMTAPSVEEPVSARETTVSHLAESGEASANEDLALFESEPTELPEQALDEIPAPLSMLEAPLEPRQPDEPELASASARFERDEAATEPVLDAQEEQPPVQEDLNDLAADSAPQIDLRQFDENEETEPSQSALENAMPSAETMQQPDAESERIDQLFASDEPPPSQDPFEQPPGELGVALPLENAAAVAFMPSAVPSDAPPLELAASDDSSEALPPTWHSSPEAVQPPVEVAATAFPSEESAPEFISAPVPEPVEVAEPLPYEREVEAPPAESDDLAETVESPASPAEEESPAPSILRDEESAHVETDPTEERLETPRSEATFERELPAQEPERERPSFETQAAAHPLDSLPIGQEFVPAPLAPEDRIAGPTEELHTVQPIEEISAVLKPALPAEQPVVFEPVAIEAPAANAPKDSETELEREPELEVEAAPLEPGTEKIPSRESEPAFAQAEPEQPREAPPEEQVAPRDSDQIELPEMDDASVPWPMREEPADSRAAPLETASPSIWDQPAVTDEVSADDETESTSPSAQGPHRFEAPLPAWESLVGRDLESPPVASEPSASEEGRQPDKTDHQDLQKEISHGLGMPPRPVPETGDSEQDRTEKENQS